MRIAAGTLMIVYGVLFFYEGLLALTWSGGASGSYIAFHIFEIISGLFSLAGGVFCVARRYRKVCFGSGLLLLLCMIYYMSTVIRPTYPDVTTLVAVILVVIGGILPVIFVGFRKRDWSKSQT